MDCSVNESALVEALEKTPIIAILRGIEPDKAFAVANILLGEGIHAVEVTLDSPEPYESIRIINSEFESKGLVVGAGTVITPEQVRLTQEAGAKFTISPALEVSVVTESHNCGMPTMPGISTREESQIALGMGVFGLKLYPAFAKSVGTSDFNPVLKGCIAARIIEPGDVTLVEADAASSPADSVCSLTHLLGGITSGEFREQIPVGKLSSAIELSEHLQSVRSTTGKDFKIIPTGGVNDANIQDAFSKGADAVGIGGDIYKPGIKLDDLRSKARVLVAAAKRTRHP